MELGYVKMRNQDGTQWGVMVEGGLYWGEYEDRTKVSRAVFDAVEARAEESRKRDCPDNGFFGIYGLAFVEG